MTDDLKTSPRGSTPVPDPTELTDKAIAKAVAAMRDYIDGQLEVRDERLSGIDEATKLRLTSVAGVSNEMDVKIGRLADLHAEKFRSVETRFAERDTRSERESKDNKVAVDAAFAAQKEAAAKQDEANAKAIDKSEKATAETIKTNQELNRSQALSLSKEIGEVKDRLTRIESTKQGQSEQRQVSTDNRTAIYGTIGIIISIVLFGIAIIGFLSQRPV